MHLHTASTNYIMYHVVWRTDTRVVIHMYMYMYMHTHTHTRVHNLAPCEVKGVEHALSEPLSLAKAG